MTLFPRASLAGFAFVLLALVSACVTTNGGGTNPVIPAAASAAQLRPGDSLSIALQGIPDPSTNAVQIDDQGLISLPYLGAISAAGATTAALTQQIREAYINRKFYNTIDVSVSVTERYVYVGGEVAHPGRIVWTPDLTAAKAIQSAGGFTLYAKETRVTLVRDQKSYDLDAKLAQRDPAQDPRLMPGDSLQVPRSPF